MTLPGEVLYLTEARCDDCEALMKIEVLRSAAGYYIGFFCPNCGPYSRESGYYRSREEAEVALKRGAFVR